MNPGPSTPTSTPTPTPTAPVAPVGPIAPWPVLAVVALMLPAVATTPDPVMWWDRPAALAVAITGVLLPIVGWRPVGAACRPMAAALAATAGGILMGLGPLWLIGAGVDVSTHALPVWLMVIAACGTVWHGMARLSALDDAPRWVDVAVPALFGGLLLYLWEVGVRGFQVPAVLLPAPSAVALAIGTHADTLLADFRQTVLLAVVRGYAMGVTAGILLALTADRIPFLARGLLPTANLVSALPIVGIAPIMVMWFGFDWQSKAAVVVIMTFFPMLVNTLAGLRAADPMLLDLMRSYGAGYWRTFFKLRLPAALPFIFNGLKISSTLALIGAIVAEFFGTPIVGMGFRISTEVARMNVDVVWATIAVAAVVGSGAYGALALAERRATFWHPSVRKG
jgi:NitT/TauT family transport system permease protein